MAGGTSLAAQPLCVSLRDGLMFCICIVIVPQVLWGSPKTGALLPCTAHGKALCLVFQANGGSCIWCPSFLDPLHPSCQGVSMRLLWGSSYPLPSLPWLLWAPRGPGVHCK